MEHRLIFFKNKQTKQYNKYIKETDNLLKSVYDRMSFALRYPSNYFFSDCSVLHQIQ